MRYEKYRQYHVYKDYPEETPAEIEARLFRAEEAEKSRSVVVRPATEEERHQLPRSILMTAQINTNYYFTARSTSDRCEDADSFRTRIRIERALNRHAPMQLGRRVW